MASFANVCLTSSYVERTSGPNPATARGSGVHVNCHPTQPRVIYASGKYIVVKNLEDPSDCFVYRGHGHATTVAKFSPNGFWVASADVAGKVRVWAWDNPEHPTKLETQVFAGPVLDLDWDVEAKKVCAVGEGSGMMVKCFMWDTGNSVGEMVGHNKRVLSVAYKPTRPFKIMTASEDMRTLFYSGPPFKLDHSNAPHTNFVNCVRYSADGAHVVSVGSDKKIQFYDGATGEPTREVLNAHDGSIYAASFSPDGTQVVTASADKTVKLWDVGSGALQKTFTFSADPQVGDMQVGVVWAATGHVVSVSLNGNVNVLDLDSPATGTPRRVVQAHQVAITALAADPATHTLYSGSFDGVVCAHQLSPGGGSGSGWNTVRLRGADKKHLSGAAHTNKVAGLAVRPGGAGELLSVGWDDSLRFADTRAQAYVAADTCATSGQPCGLAVGPVTGLAVVVTLNAVEVVSGRAVVASAKGLRFQPTCVAVAPSEDEVAVGGDDNKTHIFALAAGAGGAYTLTEVATVETRSAVSAVAYSPVGDQLAIGDAGRQVELYARGSWEVRVKGKWVFHTSKITCLAWSPDGAHVVSGSQDESLILWSCAQPMKKLQIPFAHMGGVTGVVFLAADRLASVGGDHVVATWKVPAFDA